MKVGVVSEQKGFGVHTNRYYEKQGLIKIPEKDSSGHRAYVSEDVKILNWILCMKKSGISQYEHM